MREAEPLRLEAISFDLFETLIRVDPGSLPEVTWRGGAIPTTAPLLHGALATRGLAVPPESLLTQLILAERAAGRARTGDLDERPAAWMFEHAVRGLGCQNGDATALGELLADVHMRAVADATKAEAGAVEVLSELKERGFKLALTSNLDHARSAPWLLERANLDGLFDVIALSSEVGVRKPHERIFASTLHALGIEPHAALHVGDSRIADVEGAARAGLRTAYLAGSAARVAPLPRADLILRELSDLPARVTRPAE